MSKGKKQKPKEEFVKLDMSFEDAIRLGMKTSPSYMQKLTLNEEIELPDCADRTIELVYITSPDVEESLTGFFVKAEIKVGVGNEVKPKAKSGPEQFIAIKSPYQVDNTSAFFNIDRMIYIPLHGNERVYLTLIAPNNKETNITSCYLSYTKHPHSKVS